jgi:hypothetical protein
MASSNVGRIYDVSDATGTTYFYGLRPTAGNTSVYSLRAHKASAGNFGSAASPAASAINIPAGTAGFISYATGADPTTFNAVTVVNENAGSGSYNLYRDTQAPSGTIAINNGAAATNNVNVTLNLTATNPTSGDPVSDMRFSLDGVTFGAWIPFAATAPFTLPGGDGTKTVFAQFRNGAGVISATVSDTILLDTVAPVAKTTVGKFMVSLTGNKVKWSATDAAPSSGGPFVFDVERQSGTTSLGAFAPFVTGTTAKQGTFSGVEGETDCFQARATDAAGNTGVFGKIACTGIPIDDANAAANGFTQQSAVAGYFQNTRSVSNGNVGSTLTTASQSNVKIVGVVVDIQPGGATLSIKMNGITACTVNTANASLKHKKAFACAAFSSAQTGPIVVTQTTAGPLTVDGIGKRLK